jgi:hypothetical protein
MKRALWANPAVDPAPFSRWTLRDKAAQRRSPLRYVQNIRNNSIINKKAQIMIDSLKMVTY